MWRHEGDRKPLDHVWRERRPGGRDAGGKMRRLFPGLMAGDFFLDYSRIPVDLWALVSDINSVRQTQRNPN
jgi:hypothetical protein